MDNPFNAVLDKQPRLERPLVRYAHLTLAARSYDDLLSLVCVCEAAINALHARREFGTARDASRWMDYRVFASDFLRDEP